MHYQYAVSIQHSSGVHISLITPNIVLTAAHCQGGLNSAVIGRQSFTVNDGELILHGNFNNDGLSDFIVPDFNAHHVYMQQQDGSFTKFSYKAKRMFESEFSVKFTKSEILKKEKIACSVRITISPTAISLALLRFLLVTQSTSIPINFGKARAVALVNKRKINPRKNFHL